MSKIASTFQNKNKEALLVPFVTAGFPRLQSTVEIMHQIAQSGGDIIELGVPFSDPMADGPVIQRANERALKNGVTLDWIIEQVAIFRQIDSTTPVVLMGYANSFYRMGMSVFLTKAKEVAIDGVIIVDLSDVDRARWQPDYKASGIDIISLIAPTTSAERIDNIVKNADGFLYYISLRGVTGAANLRVEQIDKEVKAIKQKTSIPLAVGFGVREPKQAAELATIVDGVVIGSRLIELAEANEDDCATVIGRFIGEVSAELEKNELVIRNTTWI